MRRALLMLVCGAATLGCKPEYDGVYIRPESFEYGGHLGSTYVELQEGIAVVGSVEIQSDNQHNFSLTDLDFDSRDRTVLDVQRGDFLGRYVFYGVAPGSTCVEVRIEGDLQECIDATVTAQ